MLRFPDVISIHISYHDDIVENHQCCSKLNMQHEMTDENKEISIPIKIYSLTLCNASIKQYIPIIDLEVTLNLYLTIYLSHTVRYSSVGVLGNYTETLS